MTLDTGCGASWRRWRPSGFFHPVSAENIWDLRAISRPAQILVVDRCLSMCSELGDVGNVLCPVVSCCFFLLHSQSEKLRSSDNWDYRFAATTPSATTEREAAVLRPRWLHIKSTMTILTTLFETRTMALRQMLQILSKLPRDHRP